MNFVFQTSTDKRTLNVQSEPSTVGVQSLQADSGVSAGLRDSIKDAELDRHIADCRFLMRLAQARYRGSHCFSDLGEADRWMVLMNEAIKDRSAAQAEPIKQTRGLK